MNNLIQTGQWFWRDKEIGFATFQKLSKKEQKEYIELLVKLPASELSTNDKTILNVYTRHKPEKDKHFITLDL